MKTDTVEIEHEKGNFFQKNKKGILIGGGVLLALSTGGLVLYYYKNKNEKKEKEKEKSPEKTTLKSTKSTFKCLRDTYDKDNPMKHGTCHEDVKILQTHLKKEYKAILTTLKQGNKKTGVDGQFGALTKEASLKHLGKAVFTPKDIQGMKVALKFG